MQRDAAVKREAEEEWGKKKHRTAKTAIMPNENDGDGRWYWEVIKDGREVVARGLADTQPAACEQANEAARKAKLIA